MRILGIDPGSNFMGLGCVETHGSRLLCIGHSVIKVSAGGEKDLATRMRTIYLAVEKHIEVWKPEAVAVEQVFFAKNAQSALKLGQARGAALAAASMANLPVFEYSATLVKQTVAGSGRAEKEQVEKMVRLLLGTSLEARGKVQRLDATDALAIAICHAQQFRKCSILHTGVRARQPEA